MSDEFKKDKMIRISYENWKAINKLKKKLKFKSINQVISVLLNVEIVRKKQKKIKLENDVIKKEEIDLCLFCKNNSECSELWKHKPSEVKKHGCFVFYENCIYKSPEQNGIIYCAKDFIETGKLHVYPIQECEKCWKAQIELIKKILSIK